MPTTISGPYRRRRASIALGAACAWLAGAAGASTLLNYDTRALDKTGRVTVAIQGNKIRVDQGASGWMIFDQNRNAVLLVDSAKQSYVEVTHAEMRRYTEQLGAARALLDDKLAGLTPEQRIAFEKMLGGGTAQRSPVLFQSSGQKRQVNGFPCTGGRLVRNTKVHEDACLAQPADIKMSAADYASLRSMYAFIHDMQQQGGLGWLPDMSEINGVPVEILNRRGDHQRLASASNDALPESNFSVPADYTRESLADLLIRSRR